MRVLLIVTVLSLSTVADAVVCPSGVKAFATLKKDEYYKCQGEKDAVLMKCDEGSYFSKHLAQCVDPSEETLLKRDADESGAHERVALGEAVQVGALFDARKGHLYNGINLWSAQTLKDSVRTTDSTSQSLTTVVANRFRDKMDHFGLGVQLELDFLCGLIHIKGSAEYLRDDRDTTTSYRMVMKGDLTDRTEQINVNTPIDHHKICDLVTEHSGPTHVVIQLVRGQRSYFVFDKYVGHNYRSEDVKGELEAALNGIPFFTIKGKASFYTNGTRVSNIDQLNVKYYGDALISQIPTQYPQAAVVFDETIRHGSRNTPIRYYLQPITDFCTASLSTVVKITEDVVLSASSKIAILKEQLTRVNGLLEMDPAIRYDSIKSPLLKFKANLEKFRIDYQGKLADVLPKLKAGMVGEDKLNEVIRTYDDSPFEESRAKSFLDKRSLEIETITYIIDSAMKDPSITLADIENARDNECIFKGQYSSAFVLKILPTYDIAQQFLDSRGTWSEKNAWYNDRRNVRLIGFERIKYLYFVENNKHEAERSICFLMKLDQIETTQKLAVSLYESGEQILDNLILPEFKVRSLVCEEIDATSIKLRSAKSGNEFVTGQQVLIEELTNEGVSNDFSVVVPDEDLLTIAGLSPYTQYRFRTRYDIQDGHSYSKTSDFTDICFTNPSSGPAAIASSEVTGDSVKVSWSKPAILYKYFFDNTITYNWELYRGSNLVKSGQTNNLFQDIGSLQPSTDYVISITATVQNIQSTPTTARIITAPVAPAKPVAGDIGDNTVKISVAVGGITLPEGVTKELLRVKYYKLSSGNKVQGSEVDFFQRLLNDGNAEVNIGNFENGGTYGIEVQLQVRNGDQLISSGYSPRLQITTTTQGSPLDKLQASLDQLTSSTSEGIDKCTNSKEGMKTKIRNAENGLNAAKTNKIQAVSSMYNSISDGLMRLQKGTNVFQRSRCEAYGIEYYAVADTISSTTTSSFPECAHSCTERDGCQSVIYNTQTKSCGLNRKRKGVMYTGKTNVISANLQCLLSESGTIETSQCLRDGINYYGADIKYIDGVASAEDCVSICADTEGCVSITYLTASSRCYTKNKRKGNAENQHANAISVTMACLSVDRNDVNRCQENNIHYQSHFKEVSAGSIDACLRECVYTDSCEAVSYKASSRSCRLNTRRRGASRQSASGWTSYNLSCIGMRHF